MTSHHEKIISKSTTDLSVTPKTKKLMEENKGQNYYHLGLVKDFLDMVQGAQAIKKKTDKLEFIKIKPFALRNILFRK